MAASDAEALRRLLSTDVAIFDEAERSFRGKLGALYASLYRELYRLGWTRYASLLRRAPPEERAEMLSRLAGLRRYRDLSYYAGSVLTETRMWESIRSRLRDLGAVAVVEYDDIADIISDEREFLTDLRETVLGMGYTRTAEVLSSLLARLDRKEEELRRLAVKIVEITIYCNYTEGVRKPYEYKAMMWVSERDFQERSAYLYTRLESVFMAAFYWLAMAVVDIRRGVTNRVDTVSADLYERHILPVDDLSEAESRGVDGGWVLFLMIKPPTEVRPPEVYRFGEGRLPELFNAVLRIEAGEAYPDEVYNLIDWTAVTHYHRPPTEVELGVGT
jgi:hypothetical protein